MKAAGVVRSVDDLGRIVIQKEIRRTLRICEGESIHETVQPPPTMEAAGFYR